MTTPPHRQPEGIPAGGQFAASTHAEPDVALRPTSDGPARIYATVQLQEWVNDGAQIVGQVDFDASHILAAMTPEQRADIEDCDYSADDVFHAAVAQGLVPDHDGPFSVYVRDAIDQAQAKDPGIFEKLALIPVNRPADAVLDTPLTPYELGSRADENGLVSGLASMSMDELIENDLESHLDDVGEKLVGSCLLMEPTATPVSVSPDGTLVVRLSGDASAIIEGFSDEEMAQYEAGRASREGASE